MCNMSIFIKKYCLKIFHLKSKLLNKYESDLYNIVLNAIFFQQTNFKVVSRKMIQWYLLLNHLKVCYYHLSH